MNSIGFLAAKFISWLVFLVCAKGGVHHWKCGRQTLWLLLVGLVFESFVCLVLEGTCFLESYVSVNL